MDSAYIDYEKFEQMTRWGVIYLTKMKQVAVEEAVSSPPLTEYCNRGLDNV
jgi:hypothetical protein